MPYFNNKLGGLNIMQKKIIMALSNVDNEKNFIKCYDLDKNDYETKYKGKLTCFKGCVAKIKFTERKNNIKFFSTWNKEGALHDEGCPYHVDYQGKIGRKKLIAYYEGIELDDETIFQRLQYKMDSLLRQYSEKDILDPQKGSSLVSDIGKNSIPVCIEDDNSEKRTGIIKIRHEDAEYISIDDIGCRKSIYGFIKNVQLEEDIHKKKFAYFNLNTKYSNVNIAFPEAFYSNEYSHGVDEFESFILKVKKMVEQNNKLRVIAFGDIIKKKMDSKGVNISIISPKRILVDNKDYWQILSNNI